MKPATTRYFRDGAYPKWITHVITQDGHRMFHHPTGKLHKVKKPWTLKELRQWHCRELPHRVGKSRLRKVKNV